ncbi:MAG: hypothetical protein IJN82_02345 [Clostridia bacterium]|nr:hypothetical protein [Clostridia bacterium]MBQ7089934.1 hypothetical protein [Clostridia bacterium]
MKERLKEYGRKSLPWFSIFALVFGRYLYYGFQYFYQLDDYFQYHNMADFSPNLWETVLKNGMLLSRPAAGLSDLCVWSNFFPVMLLAVAVISALYACTALLLKSVFHRHFGTGWLFAVIFALLPLGMEGIYWVSASSRIVCGLFFAVLGGWLLQRYFDGGRWYYLLGAILAQFWGGCYYEQVMVFSVTLFVLLGILNCRSCKWKSLWSLFAPLNMGLYLFLTSVMPGDGFYGARVELMLPETDYYFDTFLPDILGQIRSAFLGGGFYTTVKGFWRGLQILWQDHAILFLLLILGLCVLLWYVAGGKKKEQQSVARRQWWAILVGLLLAIAPVSIFLVLANPWFSLRGTVCSFAGLALIADVVLRWLLRGKTQWIAVAAAGLSFVFCIASVSELHDYKQTYENDNRAAQAVLKTVDFEDTTSKIGILGLEKSFLKDQNYFWHEHVHGCTESNWAFSGLLRYYTGIPTLSNITPLPAEHIYAGWNYESNRIDGFEQIYYYHYEENTLELLAVEQTGERSFLLYGADGNLFGEVYDEQGIGKLKMA